MHIYIYIEQVIAMMKDNQTANSLSRFIPRGNAARFLHRSVSRQTINHQYWQCCYLIRIYQIYWIKSYFIVIKGSFVNQRMTHCNICYSGWFHGTILQLARQLKATHDEERSNIKSRRNFLRVGRDGAVFACSEKIHHRKRLGDQESSCSPSDRA